MREIDYRPYYTLLASFLCAIIIDIPAPARTEENVLRLLIWEGHAPQALVSRFENQTEAKHGFKVKLHINYMNGTDDYYDLIRGGSVDMVVLTHHLLKDKRFNFIKNKLILPLDLENIPNLNSVDFCLDSGVHFSPLYSLGHITK